MKLVSLTVNVRGPPAVACVTVPPRRSRPGIGECQMASQDVECATPGSSGEVMASTGEPTVTGLNAGALSRVGVRLVSSGSEYALRFTNRRRGTSMKLVDPSVAVTAASRLNSCVGVPGGCPT